MIRYQADPNYKKLKYVHLIGLVAVVFGLVATFSDFFGAPRPVAVGILIGCFLITTVCIIYGMRLNWKLVSKHGLDSFFNFKIFKFNTRGQPGGGDVTEVRPPER